MNSINRRFFFAALLFPGLSTAGLGGSFYVDVAKGRDSNPGTVEAPFLTPSKGIKTAQAGDTVFIVKADAPIHQMLSIQNKSGEPDKPITLDGQGNTFTGCDPIKPENWPEVKPGLYRNDHLMRGLVAGNRNNDATTRRFYMLWDGRQNRMGRSSKGHQEPLLSPDQLTPGQWTYNDAETAFYFAIDPKKKLADYLIETPVRENGVTIRGTCEHWIVRNVNVTHVWNDGFNIHDQTRDFTFENITAIECGDDGLSEHEACEITVNGFTSKRNSTGMAHSARTVTINSHVTLEDNYGYNLLLGGGTHSFTDSTISAIAPEGGNSGILLRNLPASKEVQPLSVKLVDCQVTFPTSPNPDRKEPFIVDASVQLEVSPGCKIGGEISRPPGKGGAAPVAAP